MTIKRILIPTDFSDVSAMALKTAYAIAKKFKSEIIALHVAEEAMHESFKVSGEGEPEFSDEKIYSLLVLRRAKEDLQAFINDPAYADVSITGELRLGNPYHGMNTIVEDFKVDLVVIGTRGRHASQPFGMGSNTQKVVRRSKIPVLTVQKLPKSFEFKNIVYASDLHHDELEFSDLIKNTQALYQSTIHLVHVNTPANFERDAVTREKLQNFVAKYGLKNCTINIYNDMFPDDGILNFANSVKADLIALGTHGRTGLSHAISGSIAEDVVSQSEIPVLTLVTKS